MNMSNTGAMPEEKDFKLIPNRGYTAAKHEGTKANTGCDEKSSVCYVFVVFKLIQFFSTNPFVFVTQFRVEEVF